LKKILSTIFKQQIEGEIIFTGRHLAPSFKATEFEFDLLATSNSSNPNNTNPTGPSTNDIAIFHILLWIGIAYAIAVLIAMYSTCAMTINLPSLLERPIDAKPHTE